MLLKRNSILRICIQHSQIHFLCCLKGMAFFYCMHNVYYPRRVDFSNAIRVGCQVHYVHHFFLFSVGREAESFMPFAKNGRRSYAPTKYTLTINLYILNRPQEVLYIRISQYPYKLYFVPNKK